MSLIAWIIFGGLVGWIASIITGKNQEMGIILNIVVGIAGALIGGTIAGMIGISDVGEFSISSFIVALLGSVLLLSLVKIFDRERPAA